MTSEAHLIGIEVSGLLGEFDHTVKIDPGDEFVILHGPNGVGKTRLLELINAAFQADLPYLAQAPFGSVKFIFSDAARLHIARLGQDALFDDGEEQTRALHFSLSLPGQEEFNWEVTPREFQDDPRFLRMLERDHRIVPASFGFWQNLRTGIMYDTGEILARYPAARRGLRSADIEMPQPIKSFLDSLNVHLIETQRLLNPKPMVPRKGPFDDGDTSEATVSEFSKDLSRRFREALAQNSQTSQQLDKQFPGKLLELKTVPIEATEENIRERFEAQGKIRKKLAEISLLDSSDELPLPDGEMDEWQRLVLWSYLDDTEEKLSTFLPLLDRVDLLRDIVNSRFFNKRLVIDRKQGLSVITKRGGMVAPNQLSSGEQHELVLVYDLLFNTTPGSLVLIDEPEISLHVTWQQTFLSDIVRIAMLTSLRFIIATHSPQIIHNWWSRTVALGPDGL